MTQDYFKAIQELSIMNRVQGFKNIMGAGSGGFAFSAKYILPNQTEQIKRDVSIKIIPDSKNFHHFDDNLILARLTGHDQADFYNPNETRKYNYIKSENRIESNFNGEIDPSCEGINFFYEMQKAKISVFDSAKNAKKNLFVTVLILSLIHI